MMEKFDDIIYHLREGNITCADAKKGMIKIFENIFNAGICEGETRNSNFEWGTKRKDITFKQWYNDYEDEI